MKTILISLIWRRAFEMSNLAIMDQEEGDREHQMKKWAQYVGWRTRPVEIRRFVMFSRGILKRYNSTTSSTLLCSYILV